jgi:HK97 family phage prohead protease
MKSIPIESRGLQASVIVPPPGGKPEVRYLHTRDLRTEKRGERTYLVGYAANYNVLSEDLGGWRERILPGFFQRAVEEQHDVRHTQNHDPNRILGRTKAGTTVLAQDEKGLRFDTLVGTRSYETDLAQSIDRGDVDGNSFAFLCRSERWVKEKDAAGKPIEVRELIDGDLVDIATVTYPAYPETSVGIDSRALFPSGAPVELRSRIQGRAPVAALEKPPAMEARALLDRTRGVVMARRSLRPRAVEVRSAAQSDGAAELMIYDDIGEDFWCGGGITAKGVKAALDAAGTYSSIRLRINSLGGDMFEAIAIYNLLRAQGKPIAAFVDGIAASAASLIAMAGDTITMGTGALMMIHCASSRLYGNAADMRALAGFLDTCDAAGAEIYSVRTKQSPAEVKALMEAETWMGGQQCMDQGFCTGLAHGNSEEQEPDEDDAIAAAAQRSSHLLASFRHAPDHVKQLAKRTSPKAGVEHRQHVHAAGEVMCECECEACQDGRCEECSNPECMDPNCEGCPMQADAEAKRRMRLRLAQVC